MKNISNNQENRLDQKISESIRKVLLEYEYPSHIDDVYDGEQTEEHETRPLKPNLSLLYLRQRLWPLMNELEKRNIDNAKHIAKDLFNIIDAMNNQGYYLAGGPVSKPRQPVMESLNGNIKKKYINRIYKSIQKLTSYIYKDDNWSAAKNVLETISNVIGNDGEFDVWCENGGYWKRISEFPNYKEFKIRINLNNGVEINGSLKCHSAGTLEDPFSSYDITVTLW